MSTPSQLRLLVKSTLYTTVEEGAKEYIMDSMSDLFNSGASYTCTGVLNEACIENFNDVCVHTTYVWVRMNSARALNV